MPQSTPNSLASIEQNANKISLQTQQAGKATSYNKDETKHDMNKDKFTAQQEDINGSLMTVLSVSY